MKNKLVGIGTIIILSISGCIPTINEESTSDIKNNTTVNISQYFPKIASWLAKKDEIIQSGKPYDLVMTGWFTYEEAAKIKEVNPDAILLAGLSANWVWDNEDWMTFLTTAANYGKEPILLTEKMFLHNPDGDRCGFGWASEDWGHEEIYAMDPRNEMWVDLITSFYMNALDQPQHDGIIVDMVVEENYWCPEAISANEWQQATIQIFEKIQDFNDEGKLIVFNAGRDINDIDAYAEFFDGYLMENFMGSQLLTTYSDGLEAGNDEKFVIYAVDTDDTGEIDLQRMRLGLTLSLMNDNTYFTYDFGPRNHGQAWWFPEYDANLGTPLGEYYLKDNAYWREFEKGVVISSPTTDISINFERALLDISTNTRSTSFTIQKGDGRIFIQ